MLEQPDEFDCEPIETDEEMLARQEKEAEQNAAIEAAKGKKAQVKHGWQQKLVGGAGDLGQQELAGAEGPQPELFEKVGAYVDKSGVQPENRVEAINGIT